MRQLFSIQITPNPHSLGDTQMRVKPNLTSPIIIILQPIKNNVILRNKRVILRKKKSRFAQENNLFEHFSFWVISGGRQVEKTDL